MLRRYLLTVLAMLAMASCGGAGDYVLLSGYAQGGTYAVKYNSAGVRTRPEKMQAAVDTLLREIDFTLSGYNKASLLSRLNSGETITPNRMLCDVYDISYRFYVESEGAMDVASGPLFDIWGFGFKEGSLPPRTAVDSVMASCGMERLKARMEDAIRPDGTLCASDLLINPSCAAPVLNFNAIAQGYSCDVIAEFLHSHGVHDMLVDIGEIFCEGVNPKGNPWNVGVDSPKDGNNTPGADMEGVWHSDGQGPQGIVTSGNYRKFYVVDGVKYSHTIDPRIGEPVHHSLLSATVVAPDATTADAVATWCMVLGVSEAQSLLSRLGLQGCLIYDDGGSNAVWKTDHFNFD